MTSGHSWRQQLRNLFDANEFNGSASAKGVGAQICWDMLRYGSLGVAVLIWLKWRSHVTVVKTVKSFRMLPFCVRQLMRQWSSWRTRDARDTSWCIVMHRDAGDVPSSSEFFRVPVVHRGVPAVCRTWAASLARAIWPFWERTSVQTWHILTLMVTDAESIESMDIYGIEASVLGHGQFFYKLFG